MTKIDVDIKRLEELCERLEREEENLRAYFGEAVLSNTAWEARQKDHAALRALIQFFHQLPAKRGWWRADTRGITWVAPLSAWNPDNEIDDGK